MVGVSLWVPTCEARRVPGVHAPVLAGLAVRGARGRGICCAWVSREHAVGKGGAHVEKLVGRHVRLMVSEYQRAETGYHYSRIVLWYREVEDLGVALHKALGATWAIATADFLRTSCKGFPP